MSEYSRSEGFEEKKDLEQAFSELWEIAIGYMSNQDDNKGNGDTGEAVYAFLGDKANLIGDGFARALAQKLKNELAECEKFAEDYPNQMSALDAVQAYLEDRDLGGDIKLN